MPAPHDMPSLKRSIGMFSYYSNWIKNFSEKIILLVSTKSFPIEEVAFNSFNTLKADIASPVLNNIDKTVPFVVETDAS